MDTQDDAPLYPLIGYTAGIIDGAIALRLEYATTRAEYAASEGPSVQFVMSPKAALELAEALRERGALAAPDPAEPRSWNDKSPAAPRGTTGLADPDARS